MARIAVVSAMEIELAYLYEALGGNARYTQEKDGVFHHRTKPIWVYGALLGIGKVNAAYRTAEIIRDFAPDLVINVGFAGGMKEGAAGGDVVIGNDYVQVDFRGLMSGMKKGAVPLARPYVIPHGFIAQLEKTARETGIPFHTGRVATGDFFLNSTRKKQELQADFAPVAYDMESAAVAHVCAEKEIAFVAVRTLSDMADDDAESCLKAPRESIERRPIRLITDALETFTPFLMQVPFCCIFKEKNRPSDTQYLTVCFYAFAGRMPGSGCMMVQPFLKQSGRAFYLRGIQGVEHPWRRFYMIEVSVSAAVCLKIVFALFHQIYM